MPAALSRFAAVVLLSKEDGKGRGGGGLAVAKGEGERESGAGDEV